MARYTDAKCRLCRRQGKKLFLKGDRCSSPKCPVEKKGAVPPGQHGFKGGNQSEYSKQLREKQKARRIYGVLERQFKIYAGKALKAKGVTGEKLLQILETRLDNVVYRMGLVSSRSTARQLIRHGRVSVDGKKVDIPSFQVKAGQVVVLSPKIAGLENFKKTIAEKRNVPAWLERQATGGKIVRLPLREDCPLEIDENLVVEYYSR